jgi:hypothetical protein
MDAGRSLASVSLRNSTSASENQTIREDVSFAHLSGQSDQSRIPIQPCVGCAYILVVYLGDVEPSWDLRETGRKAVRGDVKVGRLEGWRAGQGCVW